jgi:hypothetical protein
MTERILSKNGAVLHRCGSSDGCMCVYDPECTGKFGRRLVRLPVWLDVLLRPGHAYRVLVVRRQLR